MASTVLVLFKFLSVYFLVSGLRLLSCNGENKDLTFSLLSPPDYAGLLHNSCSANVTQMKLKEHGSKSTVLGVKSPL